jgi:hypothetical protein
LAVIEQVPIPTIVTVLPATLQTAPVVEVNITGRPDVAVAEIVNGATGYDASLRGPKVIVWEACSTVNICVTGVAGGQVEFPA